MSDSIESTAISAMTPKSKDQFTAERLRFSVLNVLYHDKHNCLSVSGAYSRMKEYALHPRGPLSLEDVGLALDSLLEDGLVEYAKDGISLVVTAYGAKVWETS